MPDSQRAYWSGLVRPARRALGLTQTDLAEASGVSRRTVGNIEAGRVVPHRSVLDRLDAVLGFIPDDSSADWPLEIRNWISAVCPLLMRLDPVSRSRVMHQAVVSAGYALAEAAGADDS